MWNELFLSQIYECGMTIPWKYVENYFSGLFEAGNNIPKWLEVSNDQSRIKHTDGDTVLCLSIDRYTGRSLVAFGKGNKFLRELEANYKKNVLDHFQAALVMYCEMSLQLPS